jgi:hypothetical protein
MLAEEAVQLIELDQVHAVVQVDVCGAGHDVEVLRFGPLVGILAELAGVGLVACDEQHRAWRDRLDVTERVEVRELDVAGQGRVRGEFR